MPVSLSRSRRWELRGKEVYRRERRVHPAFFSRVMIITVNNQQSSRYDISLYLSPHLDEVRNLRTVNKAPAYEAKQSGKREHKYSIY